MRRVINDRKTHHRFVELVRYCKILVTFNMQSAHYEVALYNYRNRTFLNRITQCVPSPEDESKFKTPHSFNFVFLGRVSLNNTPLNQYSDIFLAASIYFKV